MSRLCDDSNHSKQRVGEGGVNDIDIKKLGDPVWTAGDTVFAIELINRCIGVKIERRTGTM